MNGEAITEHEISESAAASWLRDLEGQTVLGSSVDDDALVSLQFGGTPGRSGVLDEGWRVRLYGCYWRVSGPELLLVGSGDDVSPIESKISDLDGRVVAEVTLGLYGDVNIRFDGDLCLSTFTVSTDDTDQWLVTRPDGKTLTTRGGGRFQVALSDSVHDPV